MSVYDVVVVGAGVEGSATAYHLAKAGKRTLLLEQFPLPHSRGSSHGQTRITRKAYPEPFYSAMMEEATAAWLSLQAEADTELYRPIGYLAIGKENGELLRSNAEALRRTSAPFSTLKNAQFRKQYPMLSYPPDYGALLDPNGGLLRADKALNAFQTLFGRHGGVIRDRERVTSVTPGSLVTVRTSRDQYLTRSVVLCCGPWSGDVLTSLGLQLPLQVVRITVCYWRERDPGSYSEDKLPTFYEAKCCDGHDIYGLPAEEYPGCVKLCLHHGPPIHPDRRDDADDSWVLKLLKDYVGRHFPGLEPTPAVVETCIYTNTPDKNFILDTHPVWKNIVIGAGFSGHGFKLAPVVGRILSELAQGKAPSYDLSPFRVGRFSVSAARL